MGNPLIPPPLLLTKMLSLGAIAMISTDRKLLKAVITPFSCHLPENKKTGHFWPFFHHLCLLMGNPFTLCLLLLIKMLSLDAVAMISVERKLLQATITPFSHHLPKNSIFGRFSPIVPTYRQLLCCFWPFFTISSCLWATP